MQCATRSGALAEAFLTNVHISTVLPSTAAASRDMACHQAAQYLVQSFHAHLKAGRDAHDAFCAWLEAVLQRVPIVVVKLCLDSGLAEVAFDRLGALPKVAHHIRT
jgi:hypothetical protein